MAQKKILVVDDDPHIGEVLSRIFQKAGYAVHCVLTGEEALTQVARDRPDLVILDVMMPGMDGWEVCKSIRDDPATSDIRIVMLTARDSDRDRMIGKDVFGVDEYVTKPFGIDPLLALCKGLLHG